MVKVWHSFGSEHSANLVMIGRFTTEAAAIALLEVIERLQVAANADEADGVIDTTAHEESYTDRMLEVSKELQLWTLSPSDYASFVYNVNAKRKGATIEFHTDDEEILGYVKLLIARGAKVEMYSADDYSEADMDEELNLPEVEGDHHGGK